MDVSRSTLLTAASLADKAAFRLGLVEVRPATRTISRGDSHEKVEPRVMQVLVALAEAYGEVLTREALFYRCWGGVYVGDDSLNRAIAGVRRVAAGIAADSFEVETIPRTGYRLIAEERPVAVDDLGEVWNDMADTSPAVGISRRWLLAGGAAAAMAGGVFLYGRGAGASDPAVPLMAQSRTQMRSGTEDGKASAVRLSRQAVRVSPGNAEAWGLLALTMARSDEHAMGRATIAMTEIESAADRALQIDPGNADARAALAIAIPYFGDWLAAERRFDAVLAEHPDHVFTRDSRQFMLGAVGRMKESGVARIALPESANLDATLAFKRIYALWFLGRIAEADRAADQVLEIWPREPGAWFARLWVLAGTGRLDRARAHVADRAARPELPPPVFAGIDAALEAAQSGQPGAIAGVSQRLLAGVRENVAAVVNAMMLLNVMGALDQAFDLAQAYYLERGPLIAALDWRPGQPVVPDQRRRKTNMIFTPLAAPMQQDPRFMPLMEEIGLADYWARRGIAPDFLRR